MVPPAAAITSRPTAELPVKLTMSIRGSVVSSLLARVDAARRDHVDDTGRDSVCSSMIRASARPASGVNGDGLSTRVFLRPARAPTFIRFRLCGKFHGVSIATTPSGSWRSSVVPPRRSAPMVSSIGCQPVRPRMQYHEGQTRRSGSAARWRCPAPLRPATGRRTRRAGRIKRIAELILEAPCANPGSCLARRPGVEGASRGRHRRVDLPMLASGAGAIVVSVAGETSSYLADASGARPTGRRRKAT